MERNGAPSFQIPWYVSRQTSSDRGNHNIGKRHAYYHEICAFSMENAPPFRPVSRLSPDPGGTPPPNIPGKLTPPLDPCPPASEGGVHCYHGTENGHFPAAAEALSPDLHVFARFGRFSGFHCISMGISLHIHGTGPNVSVPRFLRFPRTCTFSPVLAVLVDFTAYPWGFHFISTGPDRTCPFHVFSVFPGLARFLSFWPF
jgi:hypothetical protein